MTKLFIPLLMFASVPFMSPSAYAQAPNAHEAPDNTHAKGQSEGAGAPEIIPHRLNSHDSITVGSTGVITPAITYHGGAVMSTPNLYLIWYGNWNQTNGSDTPDGQQIVRDFLFGLSGSNY